MLSLSLPRKSEVRLTDCLDMTIAVDWDVKPQTKNIIDVQVLPTISNGGRSLIPHLSLL